MNERNDDLVEGLTSTQPEPEPPKPGDPGLYALRVTAASFGHNAPLYSSTPLAWRLAPYNGGQDAPYPNDWEGNSITENLNYRHFINITHLVTSVAEDKPAEAELFGKYWEKYGQ